MIQTLHHLAYATIQPWIFGFWYMRPCRCLSSTVSGLTALFSGSKVKSEQSTRHIWIEAALPFIGFCMGCTQRVVPLPPCATRSHKRLCERSPKIQGYNPRLRSSTHRPKEAKYHCKSDVGRKVMVLQCDPCKAPAYAMCLHWSLCESIWLLGPSSLKLIAESHSHPLLARRGR